MIVTIKRNFSKEFAKLPNNYKLKINEVLKVLESSENLQESGLDFVKLLPNKNYYRIRVGIYRIGLEYINPDIILITVFHRQDDYKSFPK